MCFADNDSDVERRRATERRRLNEGPTFHTIGVIYELEALATQLRLLGCYGSCQDRYGYLLRDGNGLRLSLRNANPRWGLLKSVPTKIR